MTTASDLLRHLDPMSDQLEQRITHGIEANRKANASLKLTTQDGKPMANATVRIEQIGHDYLFGANSFMYGGHKTDEQNAQWEQMYTDVFNSTVVGLFWSAYEPQEGVYRYASGSEPMYRRPPVDDVLAWCTKHNMTPKGHNLLWANPDLLPNWVKVLPEHKLVDAIDKHIALIAERYDGKIAMFDVVNELFCVPRTSSLPKDFATLAYKLADRYFTKSRLFVNEATAASWMWGHREYSPYLLLLEHFRNQGVKRIQGMGLQFHMFNHLHSFDHDMDHWLLPQQMLQMMDQLGSADLPMHISEITIGSSADLSDSDGETVQAKLVRNFYRLWFSHPGTEAIYWWNLADGNAWGKEAQYLGGLLRDDLSPKPAYDVIKSLIHDEWQTRLTLKTDDEGRIDFRGFKGQYRLTCDGKEATCGVHGDTTNHWPTTVVKM
jgi:GH35 family endo-1,4-beta-xylanase